MVLHDLLFGWVTRCGAGLPLAFVLAYLGAVALERRQAWISLGLNTLLTAAVLVADATTGFEPFVLALPILLIVFGIGRAVRHRTAMSAELKARSVELQRLRDERVALELSSDRARLSQQLDGLLQERLGQLTTAADSGRHLDPDSARALFESIERDSRATLDGMREIVGLLRGGDVALAPAPTVAHLDALLARRTRSDSRLTVVGDPRSLPATVELSAYRIVEHLVDVMADAAGVPDRGRRPLRRRRPRDPGQRPGRPVRRPQGRRGAGPGARQVPRRLARRQGEPGACHRRGPGSRCRDRSTRMILVERIGIALGVLLLVVLPTALHGWPDTLTGNLFILFLTGRRSRVAVVAGTARGSHRWWPSALFLAAAMFDGWFPDTGLVLISLSFAVLALGWTGRAAWLVTLCAAAYLVPFDYLTGGGSWVATVMFTVPPYAAGTVLRLRQETADELALRAQELEDERELFAEIALRHERARIASELHDIVGHAISVMVIQAAAGQRLVEADPERAKEAFAAISESARQGTQDLQRLIELLAGTESDPGGGPDLLLVDEVVTRAGRSGLNVTCRFEGDRDRVPQPVAHLAFRVVQESLTNALRHAPGAEVRIVITVDEPERGLAVRVENDRAEQQTLLSPAPGAA